MKACILHPLCGNNNKIERGGNIMDSSNTTNLNFLNKAMANLNLIKSCKNNDNSKLLEEIKLAIDELEGIRKYFDCVDEPELIDYAIYREKAAITRLSYLLRVAKKTRDYKISEALDKNMS